VETDGALTAGKDVDIASNCGAVKISEDITAGDDVKVRALLDVLINADISADDDVKIVSLKGTVIQNGEITAGDDIVIYARHG